MINTINTKFCEYGTLGASSPSRVRIRVVREKRRLNLLMEIQSHAPKWMRSALLRTSSVHEVLGCRFRLCSWYRSLEMLSRLQKHLGERLQTERWENGQMLSLGHRYFRTVLNCHHCAHRRLNQRRRLWWLRLGCRLLIDQLRACLVTLTNRAKRDPRKIERKNSMKPLDVSPEATGEQKGKL